MIDTYTVLCPFSGLGAGALGFQRSRAHLFGREARFTIIGGIDIDPDACADFRYLTGAPALCADIATMTPADLRAFAGIVPPDVVSTSSPCKGSSGLLSEAKAKTEKYQKLNRLSLDWAELMVSTWDIPPKILLFENVPRIQKRAADMLRRLKAILKKAGYLIHEGGHECGEIGGLAQIRRRYLMVARHPDRCGPLLYQPPKKRVRACGEVLGDLPMPNAPEAGPLHELPAIGWMNWVRLAMIPAGGDWRDLPGVIAEGQERRAKWKRDAVEDWQGPVGTIGGPGSNGVGAVADPRVKGVTRAGPYGVTSWQQPSSTVTGSANIDNAPAAVADPRIAHAFGNVDRVTPWGEPTGTVTHAPAPSSGAGAVADPRATEWFRGTLGVVRWDEPAGTVTGAAAPSRGNFSVAPWSEPTRTIIGATRPGSGAPSVADPRVGRAFDHGYAVLPWEKPSFTVAAGSHPGQGAYSVADPRAKRAQHYIGGTIPLDLAEMTLPPDAELPLPVAIVDDEGQPRMLVKAYTGRLDGIPVIVAKDGTWHRPMTTLELAVLQGLPATVDGKPLRLAGASTAAWRERIGNAEPVGTMEAIGEQMLVTLMSVDAGSFSLSGAGGVWVIPDGLAAFQ